MSSDEIPLSRPDITELEIELVAAVLRSGRLSLGPMQEKFEQLVTERAGCAHGVAVSSGTAGLHLALLALGIGPGDEVITSPFSFIATANVVLYVGATPVFADIDPVSLNMDPARVEAAITPRTKAILAPEAFGNPVHMDTLAALAAKYEIPLIEDCCEGLGGVHRGRPIGSFGRVGVFSFYPNKQVTTGEGGLIVTDDDRLAEICRSLRNQGRDSSGIGWQHGTGAWLTHSRLGYNYRMSEMQAALGVGQLRRLDTILEGRDRVARRYFQRLMCHRELTLPTVHADTRMSWFVFVVRLANDFAEDERDRIIRDMRRHEIGASNYFPPIHLQPLYRKLLADDPPHLPVCESVAQRTIALPFHSQLTDREVDLVCQTLEVMLQREGLKRT
jgi:perosamine synthetase